MEKNIFKKLNSLEYFKKIFLYYMNLDLKKNQRIFFNRFIRISYILVNQYFLIPNGLKFIRLNILKFFIGLPIGMFISNKKHNTHMSLKKLKAKKR